MWVWARQHLCTRDQDFCVSHVGPMNYRKYLVLKSFPGSLSLSRCSLNPTPFYKQGHRRDIHLVVVFEISIQYHLYTWLLTPNLLSHMLQAFHITYAVKSTLAHIMIIRNVHLKSHPHQFHILKFHFNRSQAGQQIVHMLDNRIEVFD